MKGQNLGACWGQAAMEQHRVLWNYIWNSKNVLKNYLPTHVLLHFGSGAPATERWGLWSMPLSLALWKWQWLLRLGHKRLYSFCLVLLGHSSLEPQASMQEAWGYLDGYVDRPRIDVLANSQPVQALPAKLVSEEASKCFLPSTWSHPSLLVVLAEVPDAMQQTVPALTFLNSWPTQSINVIKQQFKPLIWSDLLCSNR